MTSAAATWFKRWYPVLLALVGVAASLAVYGRLPERMAVHWDLDGNPNGWMPRAFGAFFAPVFLLVLWQLMRILPRIDPREPNYARFTDAYDTIVAAALSSCWPRTASSSPRRWDTTSRWRGWCPRWWVRCSS